MTTFDFVDGKGQVPASRHKNLNDGKVLGGWVAKTATVGENAYVSHDSFVYDGARVTDKARIKSCSKVFGNAQISNNAEVGSYSSVSGDCLVRGDANIINSILSVSVTAGNDVQIEKSTITGYIRILDNAYIHSSILNGTVTVRGDTAIRKCNMTGCYNWPDINVNSILTGIVAKYIPISIDGFGEWNVAITDDTMKIGCQSHLIEDWYIFEDDEIKEINSCALGFWNNWKLAIKSIIDTRVTQYS